MGVNRGRDFRNNYKGHMDKTKGGGGRVEGKCRRLYLNNNKIIFKEKEREIMPGSRARSSSCITTSSPHSRNPSTKTSTNILSSPAWPCYSVWSVAGPWALAGNLLEMQVLGRPSPHPDLLSHTPLVDKIPA